MVEQVSVPASPVVPVSPAPVAPAAEVSSTALPGGRVTRTDITPAVGIADPARPSWLPSKFKSAEDMAKAYGELERRQSGAPQVPAPAQTRPGTDQDGAASRMGMPEAAPAAAPVTPASAQDLVAKMTQEYAQSGQVSAASREAFSKQTGLPASFVDNQLQWMKSQEQQANRMATERLGGEGAVRELMEWGAKNLSPEDRKAFNQAAYSGDPAMVQLGIDGLAAKYESVVGRAPRIIAGRKPQDRFGGVVPFQSHSELQSAMRDPRYKSDPAYRSEVSARLAAASEMGLI